MTDGTKTHAISDSYRWQPEAVDQASGTDFGPSFKACLP